MPPIDREVLVLRYLEQLSPAEIGEILGMTKGAVSTRHTRALARLRELLDDEREAGGDEETPRRSPPELEGIIGWLWRSRRRRHRRAGAMPPRRAPMPWPAYVASPSARNAGQGRSRRSEVR